jgi:hypothetical protein
MTTTHTNPTTTRPEEVTEMNTHIDTCIECDGCGEPLQVGVGGVLKSETVEGHGFDNPECNNPRAGAERHWRYSDTTEG